jgi:drug/metabolite transporter (DMT)-like permease
LSSQQPRLPVFQVVCIRSAISLIFTVAVLRAVFRGQPGVTLFGRRETMPVLLARGAIGASAMTVFYEGIKRLPLSDCVAIMFSNPALTAILAWVLLKEKFGVKTFAGCTASLVGVALVARPPFLFGGGEEWSHQRAVGMAFAVASAVLSSGALISIRVVGTKESSITVAAWFHAAAFATSAPPLAAGYPAPALQPSRVEWTCLAGIACCSFSANLLLNRGFQIERAARASAINYSQVLYAHLLGLSFFGERVTVLGMLGAGLILAGVLAVNADTAGRPATLLGATQHQGDAQQLRCVQEDGSGVLIIGRQGGLGGGGGSGGGEGVELAAGHQGLEKNGRLGGEGGGGRGDVCTAAGEQSSRDTCP